MTGYLQWMAASYDMYEWLGVTDAAGRIVAATNQDSLGKDRSDRDWFQSVRDLGRIHIRKPQISEDSKGVKTVAMTAPILGRQGEFLGAVTSRVTLPLLEDVFIQTVSTLQAQWGANVRVEYQFLDREGEVFSDSLLREEGLINLRQMGLPLVTLLDSAHSGFIEEGMRR
jgi:two-component system, cell cycle sensor histidine kinase and response regulator CckA